MNNIATPKTTKVVSIKKIEKEPIADITVADVHEFIIESNVVTHNSMYPKDIVSGGQGVYLSADNIYILGRQQEKDGTDVIGFNFIINIEKSRHAREKSKIPITVKFEGGLSRWSGLIDIALESKHVVKPSNGWYSKVNSETGEVEEKKYRLKDTDNKDFWMPILMDKSFRNYVKDNYKTAATDMLQDADISADLERMSEDE